MDTYPRDMIGYGANPPHPRWPGDARICVQFVINYEEGGENNVLHGDRASEAFLSEIVGAQPWLGQRHMNMESMYEYGSRAGFWRLHRIFTKRGLPCTVFAVARALERNPEACAAMREAGWDVAGHGLRWEMHNAMDEATERARIAEATALIARCIGERPAGWYTRYAPSLNTRRLLLEAGYDYDSDAYDDEIPYWVTCDGRDALVVPYSLVHNDVRFPRMGMSSGTEYFDYMRDAIDCVLREDPPRMLSFGLHNRIIGHPGRAMGLARLLDWIAQHPRVAVMRRIDIARHWRKEHPPA
jgi:putative urate catabolism protein